MKNTMKIMAVLLVVMMIFAVATPVFAGNPITQLEADKTFADGGNLLTTATKVMGLIRTIAVIAGVVVLMVIGVKFIIGSAEEKAEYKKSMMPLIIGIIIVMAAAQIVAMILNIMA